MNNFKVRAWESLNQKMHYMYYCLYKNFDKYSEGKQFALPLDNQSLYDSYNTMNLDKLSVMEYTNLNDKIDVEIYEGDIVELYSKLLIVYKGIHSYDTRDSLVGELDRKVYGYYLESPCGSWQLNIAVELDKLKVIGNIYENKELIK